jgi:hypothetical protein
MSLSIIDVMPSFLDLITVKMLTRTKFIISIMTLFVLAVAILAKNIQVLASKIVRKSQEITQITRK